MRSIDLYTAIRAVDDDILERSEDAACGRKAGIYSRHKWMIVAAAIAVLMLVGFTAMPMIFEMLNGCSVEWDDSHLFVSGVANDMAEVRDGRVYFTLDNSDITEYCSETTYFRYDFVDEQHIAHVILVGGEIDSIGWTEILFFEGGKRLSHSALQTQDGNEPAWYVTGNAEVNRDYGYVDPHRNTEQGEEYSADIEKVIPDEPSEPDAP